ARGWHVSNDQIVRDREVLQRNGAPASAGTYAWPEKPALLSSAVQRLDGPDKVTGLARYSYDITRPGMIYGKIVRSPYPHARVVSVDLTAAQKAPGVKAALVWKTPAPPVVEGAAPPARQEGVVMYQGDPVAAVAADTEE